MNSNQKGAIAEAKIRVDLLEKGIYTATPDFNYSLPFDLIAIYNNKLYKVQVKYITVKDEKINLLLRSNSYDSRIIGQGKVTHKKYAFEEVDFFGIYVPDDDQCLYIPHTTVRDNTSVMIRRGVGAGRAVKHHSAMDFIYPPIDDWYEDTWKK